MFSPSSFIASYSSTDKVIRILDTLGNPVNLISICKYQKSAVINAYLNIYMDDNVDPIQIMFASNSDALAAIASLRTTINALKPNCKQTVSSGSSGSAGAPIAIVYNAFLGLRGTSSFIPFQWYDVTDTGNNLMNTPKVYRVQTLGTNDAFVSGYILSESIQVKIDLINGKLTYYFDGQRNNLVVNCDMKTVTLNSNCNNCMIMNDSTANLNSCNHIYIDNASTAILVACYNLRITNHSNIQLGNSHDVTFDNQIPGTIYSGVLTFIDINRGGSNGRVGKSVVSVLTTSSLLLDAYSDNSEQEFNFDSINGIVKTVRLKHFFYQAEAVFNIKMSITASTSTPYNNKIIVMDDATSTVLYTIQQNEVNNNCIFTYNHTTNTYEFTGFIRKQAQAGLTWKPTFILAQTVFDLSTYHIPITQPTELEMYINGIKQIYGMDYYYDSGLGQIIYLDGSSFPLNPVTEHVEFIVY